MFFAFTVAFIVDVLNLFDSVTPEIAVKLVLVHGFSKFVGCFLDASPVVFEYDPKALIQGGFSLHIEIF